ncbi:hypothetical protein [Cesiribacter sp. SM1]|uniref:hypothetical protein n=1 Tax=Cesiribacter sp. SM1 TaxID=2861196 RepID=UPI001CD4FC0D|nr:hypothetical protein [Cesiribacter sp. SM1]
MAFLANERCLTCSKELDGRFDKIYCNDLCRATYHNRKKSVDERCVRAVNKILLNNREVLKDLNEVKKLKPKKDMLLMKGFNFDFYTQVKDLNNRTYKFCYEWGYRIAAIDEVEIVQLDESSFLPGKK